MEQQQNNIPLGEIAVVLLPSVKMKAKGKSGKSFDDELHDFLMERFSGYTVSAGNISGYWRDSNGGEQYGEHREYKIAFSDPDRLPELEIYIARLAAQIDENCIYYEVGSKASLIPRT